DAIHVCQVCVVPWHTFGDNMVGGGPLAAIDRRSDYIFVNGQGQGLADMNVVERFDQVVEAVVVDPQLWNAVDLFRFGQRLLIVRGRDVCLIDLARLILLVVGRIG